MTNRTCTVDGCAKPHYALGFCSAHRWKFQQYGDPLGSAPIVSDADRIWASIERGDPGDCWEWKRARDRDGYGVTKIKERQWRVHRWVFESLNGPLPNDLVVRHSCDNPPCCNPRHLLSGTVADNADDAVERGRTARGHSHGSHTKPESRLCGTDNGSAVLTDPQVREIRARYARGEVQTSLAKRFGVSQPLISQIVRRKVWTHLD